MRLFQAVAGRVNVLRISSDIIPRAACFRAASTIAAAPLHSGRGGSYGGGCCGGGSGRESSQRRWLHWVDTEPPYSDGKGKAPAALQRSARNGSHHEQEPDDRESRLAARKQAAAAAAAAAAAVHNPNVDSVAAAPCVYHHAFEKHLATLGLANATEVQLASRTVLFSGDDVIINAETGCGKTLAFLAPFVSTLYEEGAASCGQAVRRRCLVLAPTLELCLQIRNVFDSLAAPLGVTAQLVHKREMVQVGPQTGLLVGMPRYLSGFNLPELARGCLHVVVDEADTLLSSEGQAVWQVLSQFRRLYGIRPFRGMVDPASDSATALFQS